MTTLTLIDRSMRLLTACRETHQGAVAWPTEFHRAACRPWVLWFRRLNPGGTHGV